MSTLDKLTFIEAEPARREGEQTPAMKFVKAVEQQIEAAKASEKGEKYTATVIRYSGKGDQRTKQEVQRPVRQWFNQLANGQWYVAVRYGNRPLKISEDGKHAVLVKEFKQVIPTLNLLKKAAEAGELNQALLDCKRKSPKKKQA